MRRSKLLASILILALSLMVSCHKDGVSVSDLRSQVYVHQNGDMGLSVFFQSDSKDPLSIGMTVKSPSSLSWNLTAYEATFEDTSYIGSADIAMPSGMQLEQGTYTLVVSYKDGSSFSQEFEVSYGDVSKALEDYAQGELTASWFHPQSNVTVLGN